MVELQHLRHFLAVLQTGNFNQAARQLHISQPALTKSIQRMEELLGHPIFDRTPKPVPTTFGLLLAEHARAILSDMGDLEQEVSLFRGLAAGKLTVGAGPIMADAIMGPAVGNLMTHYPQMRIMLHIDNYSRFPTLLRSRELDLFIADISELDDASDLVITQVPPQPIIWFCRKGHPILDQSSVTFMELLKYPIVAPSPPRPMRDHLNQSARSKAPFEISIVCSHYSTLKTIVDNSHCICGGIEPLIRDDVAAGNLAVIPVSDFTMNSNPGLVTLKNRRLSPAAEALIREIQHQLTQTMAPEQPRE
ncbi:MAG: LysR family transcriptional regulator [Verrucomicrobia bacterium]|nr:LysR family transcriptional regulator [Verrucomicrobiota bacterium]